MSNADDRHTQLKALAEGLLAIEGLCHVAAMVLNVRGEFNMWRERAQHIGKFAEQIDAIRFARLYERAAETAPSRPASAPSTDFRMSEIAQGAPATTGASTGPQRGEEPTGATLAPDCRDMATVTSAPSSPRRWWLNTYSTSDGGYAHQTKESADSVPSASSRLECVPVVEASAYDAAVRERARTLKDHVELAAYVQRAHDAIPSDVVPDSIDCRVRELVKQRDAARAELANARRLTPEVVERAAEAIAAKAGFAWEETNLLIDARHIRGLARAALLAAGFQEVAQ